jgi:hypothetical protein
MSSSRKNVAANGFGRGSLTVAEAWVLYRVRYLVPSDMRLPRSDDWRMAVNGVGVLPPPPVGTKHWRDVIRTRRARLTAEARADPTWAPTGYGDW